jgi:hypothetical protein
MLSFSARGQPDKTSAFICLDDSIKAPQSGRCVFESRRASVDDLVTIKTSPARRDFKEMLGQNNHFLITIMIGLDAVASGEARLSDEFSTSWAPHDVRRSAMRSREFACKALTAWLTDAVGAYINGLLREPCVITDSVLAERLRAAKSLDDKICTVANVCNQGSAEATLLVRTAVIWRNRLVHFRPRDKVESSLSEELIERHELIAYEYRGLDVARLLSSISKADAPTLKEITSLVRAAHNFVSLVDDNLLQRIDLIAYVKQVLSQYISDDPARRINNVWGKDESHRVSSLIQICKQYGMTACDVDAQNGTPEGVVREISAWTPAQARVELLAADH